MSLEDKLEEFKMIGMYDVRLNYGAAYGVNDFEEEDRMLYITGTPIASAESIRIMFLGSLEATLEFDFTTVPQYILPEDYEIMFESGENKNYKIPNPTYIIVCSEDAFDYFVNKISPACWERKVFENFTKEEV